MDSKRGLKYETTNENKQRRKIIPTKDYGLATNWTNRIEHWIDCSIYKCRQGLNIFTRHVRSARMVYTIIIFLITVWLSGYLANAGLKFESLLIVVIGFILLIIVATTTGKK